MKEMDRIDFSQYFESINEGSGLRWRVKLSNRTASFSICGCKQYRRNGQPLGWTVRVNKKLYYAHRVVFKLHFPDVRIDGLIIDHLNGNPFDNRIENLRLVTQSLNMKNICKRSDNKSGVTGVSFYSRDGTWRVSWTEKEKRKQKFFKKFEDAVQYRLKKISELVEYTERHGK